MEKILFERLRSVLLHQDLSVIKHNLLKRRKCFGFCFILLTFPAHGKLTIVKTCGVSTQSPCSDRSELLITMQWKGREGFTYLIHLKIKAYEWADFIVFLAPLNLACGQTNVIDALTRTPTPA